MSRYKRESGITIGKCFFALITIICLTLDCWYLYIHNFGTEKIASTTVIVSDMEVAKTNPTTGETITETKCFIEVNMYDNAFEIKFNELMDESQTHFYSTGIQLLTRGESMLDDNIFDGNYSKVVTESFKSEVQTYDGYHWMQHTEVFENIYDQVLTNKTYYNLDVYEHQSSDDYDTPLGGNSLQNGTESFKVQVTTNGNKDVFRLSFKNYDTKVNSINNKKTLDVSKMTYIGKSSELESTDAGFLSLKHYYKVCNYYRAYDIYYLIEYIANSVKGLASGFKGECYIQMPDIFNVERFNGEVYVPVGTNGDETVNLYSETINFQKIKITKNSGSMTKSNQSIFNKLGDFQNYDSDPDTIDTTDYLTGRCLIKATLDDLEWNATEVSGKYLFGLSEEFKSKWNNLKSKAMIRVVIDTETLTENNISYSGFDFDSLSGFMLYEVAEENGTILYQGVAHV